MESPENSFRNTIKQVYKTLVILFSLLGILTVVLVYLILDPNFSAFSNEPTTDVYVATEIQEDDWDTVENGIHVRTGLIEAEGLMETVNNCTNCHSSKLVIQNRMTAQRWAETIDWMQETQNLWDLGKNEEIIINYLVTNYPAVKKGRRQVLQNIEWYELED